MNFGFLVLAAIELVSPGNDLVVALTPTRKSTPTCWKNA